MNNYKNMILLKDKDSKNEKIDLIIFTNEETETIEKEIYTIKEKWYNEEYPFSLLEEIINILVEKYAITYYYSCNEIYY